MKYSILFLALAFLLTACGGTGVVRSKITTSVKLASETVENQLYSLSPVHRLRRNLFDGGQASAGELESLKYFITNIALCQSMTISGSGFSNASGCINIYSVNPGDEYTYHLDESWEEIADVARADQSNFIDLMDAQARAALTSNVSIDAQHLGSYQWGYINWAPVVKVKASVEGNSQTFRTIDGVTTVGGLDYVTTAAQSFTSPGAAEEAVIVLNNGGNWFKAQSALEITQADVDAGTQFAVDLTFNPEGLIKAYTADNSCSVCALKDVDGNQFSVPMLAVIPVLRKATEATKVQTYVASVSGTNSQGTDNFDVRMDIYSAGDDGSVRGIDIHSLFNEDTATFVYDFSKVSYVRDAEDGSLNFLSWNEGPLVTGFEQLESVGESITVTLHCGGEGGNFNFKGCGQQNGDPETMELTFRLESIAELR